MRRLGGGGGGRGGGEMGDKKKKNFEIRVATGFKSGSSYCVNHQTVNPKDITRKYSDFWHREAYLKKKNIIHHLITVGTIAQCYTY